MLSPSLGKWRNGDYGVFLPFSQHALVFHRKVTHPIGIEDICILTCLNSMNWSGEAVSSALQTAIASMCAAQVFCSLGDLELALLKASLTFPKEINLPKTLGSRSAPLFEGEHLTWRSLRSLETDGAEFPEMEWHFLKHCSAVNPGILWCPAPAHRFTRSIFWSTGMEVCFAGW